MRKDEVVAGSVSTNEGFYIGDVCYVLGDAVYYNMWGRLYHYEDGVHYIEGRDASFAVAATMHGDGEYIDNEHRVYGVDAGVIGLVPLELVDKREGLNCGFVWTGIGTAAFNSVNGVFNITMPDGSQVHIDTDAGGNEEEYFEEDDDEDDIILADDDEGYDEYEIEYDSDEDEYEEEDRR